MPDQYPDMKNLLTFDIEDNFTVKELVDSEDWNKYEVQVVENTNIILDLLDKYKVKATFFVLGKIAERRPEVIEMIILKGHEIASHGYIHERIGTLGRKGFEDDVIRSRKILESVAGRPIKGFRAMAFSIRSETVWALDFLREQGFAYDSSITSSYFNDNENSFKKNFSKDFKECSPSSCRILGRHITYGGGSFFRLAPYPIISHMIRRENNRGKPFVAYAHAWEFNKDQPKRNVSLCQSLAQSPLTFTTPRRIERLLQEFTFTSIEDFLESNK